MWVASLAYAWKNAGVYANYANDRIWQQVSLCQALQSNLSRVALK